MILPVNFNCTIMNKDNLKARIVNGYLIEGEIDKYSIMKNQKGIINSIQHIYGNSEARTFINNLNQLGANFLKIYGLTTSLADFYFDDINMERIRTVKNIKFKRLYENLKTYPYLDSSKEKIFSDQITRIVDNSEPIDEINKHEFHHFYDIILSGAKGDLGNITKMCYSNLQMTLGNKIYSGRSPYLAKYDNNSKYGLGVVEDSYLEGLNSMEIQMINENAIYSAAQQQLQTAKPGYLNKRINENVKDYKFCTDFTIRNPNGYILMPHYFNSFDSEKETDYKIHISDSNIDTLLFTEEEAVTYKLPEFNKFNKYIKSMYAYIKYACTKLNKYEKFYDIVVFLPFDFELILQNIGTALSLGAKLRAPKDTKIFKDMSYIVKKIDHILLNYNTSIFKEIDNINKINVTFALYYYFNIKKLNLTKETYDKIFDVILDKIIFAQQEAGIPLLVKSGTSLGSIVTQSLLNSIHRISGEGNVQDSLEDNFNVRKKPRVDNLMTYVEDTNLLMNSYMKLNFKELVDHIQCEYGSETKTRIHKIISSDQSSEYKSGLYFRFVLNVEKMIEKELLIAFIFVTLIDNIQNLIIHNQLIGKQVSYLHISCSEITEVPEIAIMVGGGINDVRTFINNFTDLILSINIRETNIDYIYTIDRDQQYKKCYIRGITYDEALNIKLIKNDYIITNNLYAIYEKFGVFGYLTASLINLYNFGKDKSINPKHSASLCSLICYNSSLIPLNRQGLDKTSVGKWSIIAFESQSTHLVKAAVKNSKDYGRSTNAQSIYGHKLKIGTNHSTIIMNIDKVKELSSYAIVNPKENKTFKIIKSRKDEQLQTEDKENI